MARHMLTEFRFWQQVTVDAERTILCSPENESRIKTWIGVSGHEHILRVHASPAIPDDRIFVMDHHAAEAAFAQSVAHTPAPTFQLAERPPRPTFMPIFGGIPSPRLHCD